MGATMSHDNNTAAQTTAREYLRQVEDAHLDKPYTREASLKVDRALVLAEGAKDGR